MVAPCPGQSQRPALQVWTTGSRVWPVACHSAELSCSSMLTVTLTVRTSHTVPQPTPSSAPGSWGVCPCPRHSPATQPLRTVAPSSTQPTLSCKPSIIPPLAPLRNQERGRWKQALLQCLVYLHTHREGLKYSPMGLPWRKRLFCLVWTLVCSRTFLRM